MGRQTQQHYDHCDRPLLPIRHLPEVNGGSWKPQGDEVLVKLCDVDNPPPDWHISTPAPGHPGQRWYWLLLPLGVFLGVFIHGHMSLEMQEAVAEAVRAVAGAVALLAQGA